MRTLKNEIFRFRMLTEVHCGIGVTDSIASHLALLQTGRCAIIIDDNVRNNTQVQSVLGQIRELSECIEINGPEGEPDFEYLEAIRSDAKGFGPLLIIGIGGGSTLDAAKGLAIVLTNDGPCEQYQGLELYENPGIPCVTIPTLLGSGAEVTPSAVFINREKKQKGGINGRAVFPVMALVDPKMTLGTPLHLLGSTAMDALVHATESYVARCATPVSRMYSRQATKTLIAALDRLCVSRDSMEGLSLLAQGSFQAVGGLMHSEQGLAGGASYPMGAYYSVPHGVAGGRCLPHAIMYNAGEKPGLWNDLSAYALGWNEKDGKTSAEVLARRLLEILDGLEVPTLGHWLHDADLRFLSERIYDFRGVMEQNPVDFSRGEIHKFLELMLASEATYEQYI